MDKLSIYELLSFFIPGYVALKIIEYYFIYTGNFLPYFIEKQKEDTSFMLAISLILGLTIHVITFRLLKIKYYASQVYISEAVIINKSEALKSIHPSILKQYLKDKTHNEENISVGELNHPKYMFDFAYFYLEVKGKLNQALNFQSSYFLFRNLYTILIINFLFLLSFFIIQSFRLLQIERFLLWFALILIVNIILIFIIQKIACFLREKMISRVLWGYYVDISSKQLNNN